MLTVLEKTIHGQEVVYEAERVIKSIIDETHAKNHNMKKGAFFVEVDHPKGATEAHGYIYYGNVYVMNEAGKTISHFHLGGFELTEKK